MSLQDFVFFTTWWNLNAGRLPFINNNPSTHAKKNPLAFILHYAETWKKKKKFWHYKLTSCIQKYQQGASRKYKDMTTERQKGEISRSVYQCLRSRLCPCLSPLFHESSSRVKKEGMRSRMRGGRCGKEEWDEGFQFGFSFPLVCHLLIQWIDLVAPRQQRWGRQSTLSDRLSHTASFFVTASEKPVPVYGSVWQWGSLAIGGWVCNTPQPLTLLAELIKRDTPRDATGTCTDNTPFIEDLWLDSLPNTKL